MSIEHKTNEEKAKTTQPQSFLTADEQTNTNPEPTQYPRKKEIHAEEGRGRDCVGCDPCCEDFGDQCVLSEWEQQINRCLQRLREAMQQDEYVQAACLIDQLEHLILERRW